MADLEVAGGAQVAPKGTVGSSAPNAGVIGKLIASQPAKIYLLNGRKGTPVYPDPKVVVDAIGDAAAGILKDQSGKSIAGTGTLGTSFSVYGIGLPDVAGAVQPLTYLGGSDSYSRGSPTASKVPGLAAFGSPGFFGSQDSQDYPMLESTIMETKSLSKTLTMMGLMYVTYLNAVHGGHPLALTIEGVLNSPLGSYMPDALATRYPALNTDGRADNLERVGGVAAVVLIVERMAKRRTGVKAQCPLCATLLAGAGVCSRCGLTWRQPSPKAVTVPETTGREATSLSLRPGVARILVHLVAVPLLLSPFAVVIVGEALGGHEWVVHGSTLLGTLVLWVLLLAVAVGCLSVVSNALGVVGEILAPIRITEDGDVLSIHPGGLKLRRGGEIRLAKVDLREVILEPAPGGYLRDLSIIHKAGPALLVTRGLQPHDADRLGARLRSWLGPSSSAETGYRDHARAGKPERS